MSWARNITPATPPTSTRNCRPTGWADLDASYKVTKNVQLYAKLENVFDNRFYTYGTFFDTAAAPNFGAGGAAFTDPRSLTPARPRAIYAGMRATF